MEDYKEKYEQALERARKINSGEGVAAPSDYTICETIFPELKESEDEKIKEVIINVFDISEPDETWGDTDITTKDIIAWLKKQGEQKVVKFMTKSYITPNPEFFQWIYDRLVYQHHENPNMDYMLSLKERIEDMQEIVNVKADDVLVKQNPTWSEEDEKILNSIIEDVTPYGECPDYPTVEERKYYYEGDRKVEWLKSIKDKLKGE